MQVGTPTAYIIYLFWNGPMGGDAFLEPDYSYMTTIHVAISTATFRILRGAAVPLLSVRWRHRFAAPH